MNCPPDVADVLIEILRMGILQTRVWAGQKDFRRCVQEADHIHNLPGLLNNYAPQLLEFYWNVERPLLIQQLSEQGCQAFHPEWERLQTLVERESRLSTEPKLAFPPQPSISPAPAPLTR